jgi:RsiW-degrading membrane proteinase PrsW (M82 family)
MHGDKAGSRNAFWKGLVIAVAIHGAYDFLASVSSLVGLVLFVVLVIVVDIVAFRFMKNAEKADSPIYE